MPNISQVNSAGPVVSQHHPSNSSFSILPTELLFLIFQPLCPKLKRPDSFHFDLSQKFEPEMSEYDARRFRRKLKTFSGFRRICAAVYRAVTPILFEEVVIFVTINLHAHTIEDLFKFGRHHIRSVVVFGAPINWTYHERRRLLEKYGMAIGRGLGLCSCIRNLECYQMHHTFTRDWLPLAPSLASTLTRLVIRVHGINISYALDGLDGPLETLEIVDWTRLYSKLPDALERPPQFPSEMPNLKHVALRGGAPHLDDLNILFTRITKNKGSAKPLQSLSLLGVRNISPKYSESNMEIPMAIAKACPNLVEFSSRNPTHREILEHISLRLHVLEIAISDSKYTYPSGIYESLRLEDLLAYPRTRRGRQLRTIALVHGSFYLVSEDRMMAACEQSGLEFALCEREPFGWRISLDGLEQDR
ncbi:hypothetical protein Hypma_000588 [Hypsizygus marmoreus]|uniref:F-box domain-containing protein n=1 Tax=Hypsizygus marmoreus TaxID=39966 RepID=A0A369JEU7_HYPMA|nr:hypothetical protein Hypma_000588 [Hypsizygus marmoreus]